MQTSYTNRIILYLIFTILLSISVLGISLKFNGFESGQLNNTNFSIYNTRPSTGSFDVSTAEVYQGTYSMSTSGTQQQFYTKDMWNGTIKDLYFTQAIYFASASEDFYILLINASTWCYGCAYISQLAFGYPGADNTIGYYIDTTWTDTNTDYTTGWHLITLYYNGTAKRVKRAWYDSTELNIGNGTNIVNTPYSIGYINIKTGTYVDSIELNDTTVSAPPAIPNLVVNSDLSNNLNLTVNPYIIGFNGTMTNGAGQINNCSLYLNNTLNSTKSLLNLTINQNFTLDTTGWIKGYNYNITCFNYNDTTIRDDSVGTNIYINSTYFYLQNVTQIPSNITVLNIATEHLNITADVSASPTISGVYANITNNNTRIYINGTLMNYNGRYNYTVLQGNKYIIEIDENTILGGTYPLNFEVFEDTSHSTLSLSNLNMWVKMQFFNVSNTVRSNFYEVMAENATDVVSNAQYYYCNSSYSSGNPVSSTNCIMFASGSNADPYNHTHTANSKHKVYPLGINPTTGKIGNVYVTPTSYILKRGTISTDLVYYVPNISRTSQSQTSNNNGNTWSDLSGTIDAHIHQIGSNDTLIYDVCADNSLYHVCSQKYSDLIDFPIFPPNAVDIYVPVGGQCYNNSFVMDYSASYSSSGQTITDYILSIAPEGSSDYTVFKLNNYPATTYYLDISGYPNGNYSVMVTVKDNLNLTTSSISDTFCILQYNSLSDYYLAQLVDLTTQQQALIQQQIDSSNDILEGTNMIWVIAFIIAFFIFGFITKLFALWGISGMGFVLIGLNFLKRNESMYDYGLMWFFFVLGAVSIIIGVWLQFSQSMAKNDADASFYPKY